MKRQCVVFLAIFQIAAGCSNLDLASIPEKQNRLGVDLGNIAVVSGDYDHIEDLLTYLEIPFDLYNGQTQSPGTDTTLSAAPDGLPEVVSLLQDKELLELYDIIFINCGVFGTGTIDPFTLEMRTDLLDDLNILKNLSEFVEDGGRLYVSDRSYSLLEAVFPDLIEFQGDDSLVGDALRGAAATVSARVIDPALQAALSGTAVEIEFPASYWAMPMSGKGTWLTADVLRMVSQGGVDLAPATPLLISQTVGYGRVIFTCFHNLPRVDQTWTDLQLYVLRTLAE